MFGYDLKTMPAEEFRALRLMTNERVQMLFTDGRHVVATILEVARDLNEKWQLIYHMVEWPMALEADSRATTYRCCEGELARCQVLSRF